MSEKACNPAEGLQALKAYINATPELLSLLYDMDLLPEQCKEGTEAWCNMIILAGWHRNKFAKPSPTTPTAPEV